MTVIPVLPLAHRQSIIMATQRDGQSNIHISTKVANLEYPINLFI